MKTPIHFIVASLLVMACLRSAAQADSILSLPVPIQANALFSWYEAHNTEDSTWLMSRIDQMEKDFAKAKREDLVRHTWSLRIYGQIDKLNANEALAHQVIDEAMEQAVSDGSLSKEAELYINKGLVYRNFGKIVNAFENFIKGYALMKQIGFDQVPRSHWLLYNIGLAYFRVKAYDLATVYIRQAVDIPAYKPESAFGMVAFNTLGLCYMKQLQYDSAIVAFQKSYDAAIKAKSDVNSGWKLEDLEAYTGLTQGNIGYAYFKMGEVDKALPLLEADFKISTENNEYYSALNASLALATIYLKRGLRDKAAFHMQFASKYVNRVDDHAMNSYFENLSQLREIAGDYKSALAYRDSAIVYMTRIQASEEKDILERARLELEVEKHTNAITSLESTRKRQILLRNSLLLIVILSGIIVLTTIQRRYRRRKSELERAQKELTMFTDMVREKNELLDSFSHEIEELRATDQYTRDERSDQLTALMNSHILTEDDWRQFRNLFDKVHPGFFIRLKEKMPDLSAAETRLLALTKLQLAPREMASMLGISYDSILKSRQRLRKKINLPEEGTLDELISLI